MGSAFDAEPAAWFAGHGERLLFTHSAPELVAHFSAATCALEHPHPVTECGYFEEARAGGASTPHNG